METKQTMQDTPEKASNFAKTNISSYVTHNLSNIHALIHMYICGHACAWKYTLQELETP